jgi:SAM-dependent methyltransferase
MIYPQPDRQLLNQHMKKIKCYIYGDVIDVGGGSNRYKSFFNFTNWVNANIYKDHNIDLFFDLNISNDYKHKFDTVICNQVLGDVTNPQFSINELGKILKAGGHIIITESLLNEEHDAPYDYFRFTEYGIKHLINSADDNLKIISFDKRGKYFSVIFQFINRMLINRFGVNDNSNRITKAMFYMVLRFNTHLAMFLDKLIKHKSYSAFYLGWIIVVKKI